MAKLPLYDSKVGSQAVSLPNIPSGLGSPVAEAVSKVGAQVFQEGVKWEDMISKAEAQVEASKAIASASVSLQDLRNETLSGGLFNTDPQAARLEWEQKVRKLGGDLSQGIANPRARQLFDERFLKDATSHTTALSDDVRRKRIDIVKGSGMAALMSFSDAAASAPNDEILEKNLVNGFATIDGMVASGALNYEDRVTWRRNLVDQTYKTRIFNTALSDPVRAQSMLDEVSASGIVSPEVSRQLGAQLRPLVDAQTSRAIADSVLVSGDLMTALSSVESGGKDFGPDGKPVTSPKGAKYAMQVMPATARDPGFGIKPAANDSPEEYNRVGKEYFAALLRKYSGDPAKALAAYNAGPDAVDKAIAKRGGSYLGGLPEETQKYVPAVLARTSGTVRDIQANYPALEEEVKRKADLIRPGDAAYKDSTLSHFRQQVNQTLTAQRMQNEAHYDLLTQAVIGPSPAKTTEELLSDPRRAEAYAALYNSNPERIKSIEAALEHNAKGRYTPENAKRYYELSTLAGENPAEFASLDLMTDYPNLGREDWQRFVNLQGQIKAGKKDAQVQTLHQAIQTEMGAFFDDALAPPKDSKEARTRWEVSKADAYKAIEEAIKAEQTAGNGKPVPPERAREIARGYLINGVIAGTGFMGFGRERGRGFELQSNPLFIPDQTRVPEKFRQAIEERKRETDGKEIPVAKFNPTTRKWYLEVNGMEYRLKGGQ